MTGLIPWQVCNLLPPPNNTNFEFHVVILPHFQINGKVLTSSDRFKSESDLKESDLGECEPAFILLRCGKNLGKNFVAFKADNLEKGVSLENLRMFSSMVEIG